MENAELRVNEGGREINNIKCNKSFFSVCRQFCLNYNINMLVRIFILINFGITYILKKIKVKLKLIYKTQTMDSKTI